MQDDASRTQSLLTTAARSAARSTRRHDESRGGRAADASLPHRWQTLKRLLLLLDQTATRDTRGSIQDDLQQRKQGSHSTLMHPDFVLMDE